MPEATMGLPEDVGVNVVANVIASWIGRGWTFLTSRFKGRHTAAPALPATTAASAEEPETWADALGRWAVNLGCAAIVLPLVGALFFAVATFSWMLALFVVVITVVAALAFLGSLVNAFRADDQDDPPAR